MKLRKNKIIVVNDIDTDDNPFSGSARGKGLRIDWHEGDFISDGRNPNLNGCFPEDAITAVKKRLEFLQETKYKCDEYMEALSHLQCLLDIFKERDILRQKRGVYGKDKI